MTVSCCSAKNPIDVKDDFAFILSLLFYFFQRMLVWQYIVMGLYPRGCSSFSVKHIFVKKFLHNGASTFYMLFGNEISFWQIGSDFGAQALIYQVSQEDK